MGWNREPVSSCYTWEFIQQLFCKGGIVSKTSHGLRKGPGRVSFRTWMATIAGNWSPKRCGTSWWGTLGNSAWWFIIRIFVAYLSDICCFKPCNHCASLSVLVERATFLQFGSTCQRLFQAPWTSLQISIVAALQSIVHGISSPRMVKPPCFHLVGGLEPWNFILVNHKYMVNMEIHC